MILAKTFDPNRGSKVENVDFRLDIQLTSTSEEAMGLSSRGGPAARARPAGTNCIDFFNNS